MKGNKIVLILIILTLLFTAVYAGEDVTLVTNSPYSGEYVVIYNSSSDANDIQSTGTLPSAPAMRINSSEESLPQGIKGITKIDGRTAYAMEYNNIPKDIQVNIATSSLVSNAKIAQSHAIGDIMPFQSKDFRTNKQVFRTFNAMYVYDGEYCDVYLEQGTAYTAMLSDTDISAIAKEFDAKIRGTMHTSFGDYISGSTPSDIIADTEKHGTGKIIGYESNKKITILLEDIVDGYNGSTNNAFYAGFFSSEDMAAPNQLSMIHIDIYPTMWCDGSLDVTLAYSTLAHEFQHLISYSDAIFSYEHSVNQGILTCNELWWNEAFSMAAEDLIYGTAETEARINDFNNDHNEKNVVRNGATLTFTDYDQNNDSLAANYGMACMFGQYLRTQTKHLPGGGNEIFKRILSSAYGDQRAIVDGLAEVGYPVTDFWELNRNFRIALTLKQPSGLYGFVGETIFDKIIMPLHNASMANLRGGGAIVRRISLPLTPSGAGYGIKFAGFKVEAADDYTMTVTNNLSAKDATVFGSFTVNVKNTVGGDSPNEIIFGIYDDNGVLIGIFVDEITPQYSSAVTFNDISIPGSASSSYTYKVLLTDKLDNITPLVGMADGKIL